MDLRICRYFLAIVEEGSMNRAAKVLHITQPTLSRQISQLEEELGVELFERQSRTLHLTTQGRLLARRAKELLELETKTLQELSSLQNDLHGELVIGAGEMEAMNPILDLVKQFQSLYPHVKIKVLTGVADHTREMIENGIVDVGFFLKPIRLHDFEKRDWNFHEYWSVIVPKDHPLAHQSMVFEEDLLDYPLILPARKGPRDQLFENFNHPVQDFHIAGYSSLTANGALMAIKKIGILVAIGGSPAFLNSELVTIPLAPPISTTVTIAWKDRFPKPPIQEKFLKFLLDSLAEEISIPHDDQ
ncbi:MAG: LysR family transcriptional regulator [Allobaculum sp.]